MRRASGWLTIHVNFLPQTIQGRLQHGFRRARPARHRLQRGLERVGLVAPGVLTRLKPGKVGRLRLLLSFRLWSAVYEDLQSLRQRGWLTTYHNATGQLEQSAITVIGTGEARLDYILAATERDIFYDAPMDRLGSPDSGVEWSPSVSPMASVSLKKLGYWPLLPWPFQNAAKRRMQECVEQAHRRNITARFWGHSSDPSSRLGGLWREAIWKATLDAGADW